MSLTVGIPVPQAVFRTRAPRRRALKSYVRWFIAFGLTGFLYSTFAWCMLLAGNGKSRVELAFQLPLRGLIRLLEWIHCPACVALVVGLFPPLIGLLCGLVALAACGTWRALRLGWDREKYVVVMTMLFEGALTGYACANATLSEPGARGYLTLPGRGDSLLGLALTILFVGAVSLIALSPHWTSSRVRPGTR